jgi:CDP-diacylglycerol--serine O-phosphatidyltransferase
MNTERDMGGAGRMRRLRRRFRPRTRPRFEGQSFNRLIPNIMTMLGLCCGLVAIRAAFEARFAEAAVLIVVAGVIDGLDGRLARLLKATSRFGAEFDSLADFLSFGVAPALVLYLWALQDYRGIAFAPALLFAVCSSLRLARFKAGAGCALFPLFAGLFFTQIDMPLLANIMRNPVLVAGVLILVGGLMVSTLPTWSFKNFKVPRAAVLPLLLGIGLYMALLFAEPWGALAMAGVIYLGMLPFSVRSYLRLKQEAESLLEPVLVADNGPGNAAP